MKRPCARICAAAERQGYIVVTRLSAIDAMFGIMFQTLKYSEKQSETDSDDQNRKVEDMLSVVVESNCSTSRYNVKAEQLLWQI